MTRYPSLFRAVKLGIAIVCVFTFSTFAQDEPTRLDASLVPATAADADGFVPDGWKIEKVVKGDVTADAKEDLLLVLIEDKPKKEDEMVDRARALVVVSKGDNGEWRNAAVASSLLQCTACGGAFYGAMDAPVDVSIEKGVIVVSQEHGSREVTNTTLKFRYDAQPDMFLLIGYDYATRDRADGSVYVESTNYLTGKRITETGKGKRSTKKTTNVAKDRASITEVDYSAYEEAAAGRLGLN